MDTLELSKCSRNFKRANTKIKKKKKRKKIYIKQNYVENKSMKINRVVIGNVTVCLGKRKTTRHTCPELGSSAFSFESQEKNIRIKYIHAHSIDGSRVDNFSNPQEIKFSIHKYKR